MTTLAALDRARQAWEATQPQLTIPSFWDDGLEGGDATHAGFRVVSLEPAPHLPGGLNDGAEPRCDTGLTANQPVTVAHPNSLRVGVGASSTTTEAAASPPHDKRGRLQEGA